MDRESINELVDDYLLWVFREMNITDDDIIKSEQFMDEFKQDAANEWETKFDVIDFANRVRNLSSNYIFSNVQVFLDIVNEIDDYYSSNFGNECGLFKMIRDKSQKLSTDLILRHYVYFRTCCDRNDEEILDLLIKRD